MSGSCTRKKLRIGAYLALSLFGLLAVAQRDGSADVASPEEPAADSTDDAPAVEGPLLKGKILVLPLETEDLTDGGRQRALRQLLEKADEDGAEAVVFELNTKSSYEASAAGLLLEGLAKVKTPLYSVVNPSALGIGGLLAVCSNTVYVSPVAVIGASVPRPVMANDEIDEAGSDQMRSVLVAQVRGVAKAKGQNPDLAEAFVRADFELRLSPEDGGRKEIISHKDEVLTLTAEQALKVYEGKPLLAKGTAETAETLIAQEKLTGEVYRTTPNDWDHDRDRQKLVAGRREAAAAAAGDETPFGKLPEESFAGKILVMKVGNDDLMTEARFEFMGRVIEKAREELAAALILDMHTPGGYAMLTTDLMMDRLQGLPFPTYTFVNSKAKSAGSLIAIATDHIYMKPASTIGAALVITSTGGDVEGNLEKKISAHMESTIKHIATAKNHDYDVCIAFVTADTEVVRDGEMICREGEVLDLNALEATKEYGNPPKPLLAKGIVNSIEEIIELEGLEGEILEVRASPLERFAEWTQAWAAILIMFGFVGAYIEFKTPGFGIAGLVSVISFGIFFFGNYVAGNLAGWETAVVFAVGAILVIVDIFLLAGTMVVGIVGGIMMMGSLAFALVNRYDFGEFTRGAAAPELGSGVVLRDLFTYPLLSLSIATILTVILISVLMRYLPKTKMVQWLILQSAVPSGTSGAGAVSATAGAGPARSGSAMLGKRGVAGTDLRPTGQARIDDDLIDVTTESEFIPRGSEIKVIAIQGNELVVAKA